jgi:hypothetical protein
MASSQSGGCGFPAECTPGLARSWLAAAAEFVQRAHGPAGVERVLGDVECWGELIEARNRLELGNMLDALAMGQH